MLSNGSKDLVLSVNMAWSTVHHMMTGLAGFGHILEGATDHNAAMHKAPVHDARALPV